MSITDEKKYLTDKYATAERMTASDLRMITALLRSPEGCPWDREQTHESVRENFIEETYEVIEAIDNRDPVLMCEELGDVLLQVMFHARMEEERGGFSLDDVYDGICRKLILRHPHVFGDTTVSGTAQVLDNWDAIKQRSKSQTTATEALESVARSLPALMRAEKLLGRAKKAGYLDAALPDAGDDSLGARLMRLVLEARESGTDAEHELYDECDRMTERVRAAEQKAEQ